MHIKLSQIQKRVANGTLTRRTALYLCMEHWNAITEAVASGTYNDETKGKVWKALTKKDSVYASERCACCMYDESHPGHCGARCIIAWRGISSINGCSLGEYSTFCYKPTKSNALAIAILAEEALDRLNAT